ncbi:DNA gyrase inhibitor YacG [Desulfurobacterium thermolithotrophum]|uniref:DNA gyrase inhibitor YacG n=1 Tax=Desulfurobacterium thermolithotrophum TaxID=64160 RepID=UPI0013D02A91|nr:DNA gyrase inhibitor YacG [Desulfurobacterium thermolithotrophum]
MKQIKCPNCGKETTWEGNPYRPFCSEKCKLADLSKWLNEEYTLFSEEPVVEEEADSRS